MGLHSLRHFLLWAVAEKTIQRIASSFHKSNSCSVEISEFLSTSYQFLGVLLSMRCLAVVKCLLNTTLYCGGMCMVCRFSTRETDLEWKKKQSRQMLVQQRGYPLLCLGGENTSWCSDILTWAWPTFLCCLNIKVTNTHYQYILPFLPCQSDNSSVKI